MRVRRLSIVLLPPALILGSLLGASPVLAAPCDGSTTSLGNGDFETPVVPADTYVLFPAASVPPWQTTDGAGEIELWGTGFLGVPAFEGNGFAELNANTAGTLYQDVVSTSGEVMTWSLAHRAREGDDVMQVLIGDASTADVNGTAGWDYISPDLTDGVDAWGTHTDQFIVPTGQTCTRLAFRAVVAGSGNDSIGNFLDAVEFAISVPPEPEPTDPPAPAPSDPPAPNPTTAATAPPTDTVSLEPSRTESDPGPAPLLVLAALAIATVALRRLASRTRG
jgi:hypothetical protein